MSVYIKGMEMPTSCRDCPMGDSLCCGLMHGVPALWKEYTNAIRTNRRHKDCPLVPVPDHGRTVDADALEEYFVNDPSCLTIFDAIKKLQGMPVIIPADKEEVS